jgi:hypothetical protein
MGNRAVGLFREQTQGVQKAVLDAVRTWLVIYLPSFSLTASAISFLSLLPTTDFVSASPMEVSRERLRADPQNTVIDLGEDQGNVTGLHVQNVQNVSQVS